MDCDRRARRGPGASGLPTRGIFHHFIRFIPISQTPPYLNPIISLLLFFLLWYAFVFDGLTFTLMVGSAEKGARTFSLRECAPQDCPCPFPRDVGGWAVVWGFKCSHFIFISLQLNHYLSRHCADEIGLVNASRVEPWQDRLVTT